MHTKKSDVIRLVSVIVVVLLLGLCIFAWAGSRAKQTPMTYEAFKALSAEQQIETFNAMTGAEIYALVAGSDENWPVTSYDLISPANAKETIVLFNNHGDLHFNLAWPCYGGFLPESIFSIGELSGKLDVSRDGGDGGCCLSYGRNADGSWPNDSQRSVPKSSASVRTGSSTWTNTSKCSTWSRTGRTRNTASPL